MQLLKTSAVHVYGEDRAVAGATATLARRAIERGAGGNERAVRVRSVAGSRKIMEVGKRLRVRGNRPGKGNNGCDSEAHKLVCGLFFHGLLLMPGGPWSSQKPLPSTQIVIMRRFLGGFRRVSRLGSFPPSRQSPWSRTSSFLGPSLNQHQSTKS